MQKEKGNQIVKALKNNIKFPGGGSATGTDGNSGSGNDDDKE